MIQTRHASAEQMLLQQRGHGEFEEQRHPREVSLLHELLRRNGREASIQHATPPGYRYEVVDIRSSGSFAPPGPIMEIAAHPGDAPDFFYATYLQIAAQTQYQSELHEILLTDGERGVDGWHPERTRQVRITEAHTGAAVVGSNLHFLSYPDGNLASLTSRERARLVTQLAEKIASIQPCLVVVHPPKKDHPDHAYSFLLTVAALRRTARRLGSMRPALLTHDVEFGLQQQPVWPAEEGNTPITHYPMHSPDFIVDISATHHTAQYALHQHQTQMLDPETGQPKHYADLIDKLARMRGLQIRPEEATRISYGQGFSHVTIPGVTNEHNPLALLLPRGCVYKRVKRHVREQRDVVYAYAS